MVTMLQYFAKKRKIEVGVFALMRKQGVMLLLGNTIIKKDAERGGGLLSHCNITGTSSP